MPADAEGGRTARRTENHLLRTVCAIALILITYTHCYAPPEWLDKMIFGVGRFAIPVFFLISGYYSYSEDGRAEARLPAKLLRILAFLVYLKLLYLGLDAAYLAAGVIDLDRLVTSFVLWTDTTSHAWFVYSLLLVYALWAILHRVGADPKRTYFLVPLVLGVNFLFTELLPFMGVDTVKIGETTYPFIGLPFFIIGYWLHRSKGAVDARLGNRAVLGLAALGLALSVLEVAYMMECCPLYDRSGGPVGLYVSGANLYVGSVVLAVAAFIGTFRVPADRLRFPALEYIGRHLDIWMYVYFPGVIFFLRTAIDVPSLPMWAQCAWPLLAVALNILLALATHLALKALASRRRRAKADNAAARWRPR